MSMEIKYPCYRPEIWGGIECTINRVEDTFRDQLREANHYARPNDLKQIATLGIKKLRYPVLWEYHQPAENGKIDWTEIAARLECIRNHGIDPVAGLLHHGSGPVYTRLDDPDFPAKLAKYALLVAEKFPWLNWYTPVNEPLTTARFSGMYGFWYPHLTSERSFFEMLLNQIKGTILSMHAIRSVNPEAKLLQTEDLSKTHSGPILRYQADFENERRWLTYDLLCGRVNNQHYFWKYLLRLGIKEKLLSFFQENACPPDIMGFNYYVTSERFLDERLSCYPEYLHGGNAYHSYVDTEAVRTNKFAGLSTLIREAWHRYHLPLAITECHLNCTREEQLRWLGETWDNCCHLQMEGIDLRAVTAWALLGAYDWNSLLTEQNHYYETGAFSIEQNHLRPTALSKMIRSLAVEGTYSHPLLAAKGWWNGEMENAFDPHRFTKNKTAAPVLIIGCNGTLGHAFTRICRQRNIYFEALGRKDADILHSSSILAVIEQHKPWAIINAAGYVRVDDAEQNNEECFALNTTAPSVIAEICAQKNIRFMTFSSDLVFDGSKSTPYHEADPVKPLNIYGASKAEAERRILAVNPDTLIIRSSAFFGPWDKYNFAHAVLSSLEKQIPFIVPENVFVSPTYLPDLVHAAMDLFIDEEKGIWHLVNEGSISWTDFAGEIAARGGFGKQLVIARPVCEMGWKAKRPAYSVLQSERGIKLPVLETALERYFEQKLQ